MDSDPFDFYSEDPTNTGATFSSLWELQGLNVHFLPAVRKIADPNNLKRKLYNEFQWKLSRDSEQSNKEFAESEENPKKLLDKDDHHLMEKYCKMEFEKDHCAGVGDAASTVDELFC